MEFSTDNRVALTRIITKNVTVSTIQTRNSVTFETVVFAADGSTTDYALYETFADALNGHDALVLHLRMST